MLQNIKMKYCRNTSNFRNTSNCRNIQLQKNENKLSSDYNISKNNKKILILVITTPSNATHFFLFVEELKGQLAHYLNLM